MLSPFPSSQGTQALRSLQGEADAAAVSAHNSSAEDSEEEEEEDEAEDDPMEEPWDPKEGTGLALVQRLQQEGGWEQGDVTPPPLRLDPHPLGQWGCTLTPPSPGLEGPLRWLQNCLRRTARDRETEGEWGWGGTGLGMWKGPG